MTTKIQQRDQRESKYGEAHGLVNVYYEGDDGKITFSFQMGKKILLSDERKTDYFGEDGY